MAPSPPHTSFPGSFSNAGHLSCIVFFISPSSPPFTLKSLFLKYLPSPSPKTLIQTEALELTTCPSALIYEKGEPKLSYENRPVFHPFIWHLKSNYTNMLHCKTRAHCSKFRLAVLDIRGQKAEKHFCQSNDIFMYWYNSSNEMYQQKECSILAVFPVKTFLLIASVYWTDCTECN